MALRIVGPGAADVAARLTDGLEEAEFTLPKVIVADIAIVGAPIIEADGATSLIIEALTVSAD